MIAPIHRCAVLFTFVVLCGLVGPAVADESKAELDERLAEQLRLSHNAAVDLYNTPIRDTAAACDVFRNALIAADWRLDHRPTVQREIRMGLADVRKQATLNDQAWALKYLVLSVRRSLLPMDREGKVIGASTTGMTLWDRLGGEDNVKKIVNDWVDFMADNKRVNLTRDGQYLTRPKEIAAFKESLVKLASSITGGPYKYPGKNTKEAHRGMGITDAEFDASLADLHKALLRNGIIGKDLDFILGAVQSTRANIVGPAEVVVKPKPPEEEKERPQPPPPDGTLIRLIGGEEKLGKIVSDFVDKMVADKRVNFTRNGDVKLTPEKIRGIKSAIHDMASQAMGGTREYKGPKLLEIHKKMSISETEFAAVRDDLRQALLDNGVQPFHVEIVVGLLDQRRSSFVVK